MFTAILRDNEKPHRTETNLRVKAPEYIFHPVIVQ